MSVKHDYSNVPGFEYMAEPDWIIGNRLYLIRAPAYLMVSEAEISDRGTFSTGDLKLDAKMAKADEAGWRTILQMFEIWKERGGITLVNYHRDISEIHQVIQAYLSKLQLYAQEVKNGSANLAVHDESTTRRLLSFGRSLDMFARDVFSMAIEQRDMTIAPVKDDLTMTMPMPVAQAKREVAKGQDYRGITDRIDFQSLNSRRRY